MIDNLIDNNVSMDDTAAIIENLDIVISVDTSVAHLSASMGKPTWILLPFVPDWRWLLNRNDSPWYKSVKLLRQEKRGNWELVIKDLNKKLNVLYQ
jgi:ADP-heptose:LPS heptosyltransferase